MHPQIDQSGPQPANPESEIGSFGRDTPMAPEAYVTNPHIARGNLHDNLESYIRQMQEEEEEEPSALPSNVTRLPLRPAIQPSTAQSRPQSAPLNPPRSYEHPPKVEAIARAGEEIAIAYHGLIKRFNFIGIRAAAHTMERIEYKQTFDNNLGALAVGRHIVAPETLWRPNVSINGVLDDAAPIPLIANTEDGSVIYNTRGGRRKAKGIQKKVERLSWKQELRAAERKEVIGAGSGTGYSDTLNGKARRDMKDRLHELKSTHKNGNISDRNYRLGKDYIRGSAGYVESLPGEMTPRDLLIARKHPNGLPYVDASPPAGQFETPDERISRRKLQSATKRVEEVTKVSAPSHRARRHARAINNIQSHYRIATQHNQEQTEIIQMQKDRIAAKRERQMREAQAKQAGRLGKYKPKHSA